jgi:multicomponent Na+:H+ antiporter subunit F
VTGHLDLGSTLIVVAEVVVAMGAIMALTRIARGPSLADRVVAFDMLALLLLALLALISIETGRAILMDVALALALVTFVATVAVAQYLARNAGGAGNG